MEFESRHARVFSLNTALLNLFTEHRGVIFSLHSLSLYVFDLWISTESGLETRLNTGRSKKIELEYILIKSIAIILIYSISQK